MNIRPFFKKHPRVRTFICSHPTTSDIGTFTDWSGNKQLVCQCDYCGKIRIGETRNWYPMPNAFTVTTSKQIYNCI